MKCKLIQLESFKDERGILAVGSTPKDVPFEIKRFFITSAISEQVVRGQHAHKATHQLLIAVHGSVRVTCDDGESKLDFLLNSMDTGLYMPPLTWGEQSAFSPDAKLLVLASDVYEESDYVRGYADFLKLVNSQY